MGAFINADRGYKDHGFLEHADLINLNTLFSKKLGADDPWKLGKVERKGEEKQIDLLEKGCQRAWEATKK